ncbi:hypothetical protein MAPG_09616, partial [Magnaporthiopsis poae ATCC 64411]|uniref:Uncharacterized protein n=1 Tax=Magnaporthiopsis poae (strain ATCC 64411 / 73-15) TaxID=644358 RepID=A0A0C4EAE6_MAGP6
ANPSLLEPIDLGQEGVAYSLRFQLAIPSTGCRLPYSWARLRNVIRQAGAACIHELTPLFSTPASSKGQPRRDSSPHRPLNPSALSNLIAIVKKGDTRHPIGKDHPLLRAVDLPARRSSFSVNEIIVSGLNSGDFPVFTVGDPRHSGGYALDMATPPTKSLRRSTVRFNAIATNAKKKEEKKEKKEEKANRKPAIGILEKKKKVPFYIKYVILREVTVDRKSLGCALSKGSVLSSVPTIMWVG